MQVQLNGETTYVSNVTHAVMATAIKPGSVAFVVLLGGASDCHTAAYALLAQNDPDYTYSVVKLDARV